MQSVDFIYKNIAYEGIQDRRHSYNVPFENGGTLHDYVPFYFNSKSPMLYAIKCGNIENILMKDLLIFALDCIDLTDSDKECIFTDGHATMYLTEYFNSLDALDQLRWDVINPDYWNNFYEGKRFRQAEFLIKNSIELEFITDIAVYNEEMLSIVRNKPNGKYNWINIDIKKNWFF